SALVLFALRGWLPQRSLSSSSVIRARRAWTDQARKRLKAVTLGLVETFIVARELFDERRDVPVTIIRAGLCRESTQRIAHARDADLVRIEHRSAAKRRKAVAIDIYDVDVDRAQRDPFAEDTRPFVHHRIDTALHDLLVRDRA